MVRATLKSYSFVVVLVIVVTGLNTRTGVTGFDIKDFLGDEPITPRRSVKELLEYFQQDDPRGIPVLNVHETLELGGPFATTQMILEDVTISGHSQITLEYVDVNLEKLQAQVRLNIPHLEILGLYKWPGWWGTSSEGNLNISFVNLDFGAICDFGVDDEGIVQVVDMTVIFDHERFIPTLTGLTTQHSIMVLAADTFFESFILPILQGTMKLKGMEALNKKLVELLKDKTFPVDISPVDYAIAKVRSHVVREKNLDPFRVGNREINYLTFTLMLSNIELRGLSSLHRSDVIRTEFVDNRFYVTIEIATQRLKGFMDWALYTSLFPMGSGQAEILIDSLRVSLEAQQDADVRHPPILRRIDLELGNFALRSKGERNLDYMLEAAVNLIPNVFRNLLMDRKVEGILKKIIQEQFNTINLEHIIYEQLEKNGEKGFLDREFDVGDL